MRGGRELIVYLPQLDYLVHRWNESDLQANIYVYGGFGGVRFAQSNGTAYLAGIEADAESRKYFSMVKYEAMYPTLGGPFRHFEARIGAAPYEAEYDQLASWFMILWQYHPALSREQALTPMVRFFYKNALWEAGVSLQGDWMFNFMFHF
jgi:hypothetical protein